MPIPDPIPTDDASTYAVDFETFYSKDYSLKVMPTWAYVFDPHQFDAYMVSVAGPSGFMWVGKPKDFDWSVLNGKILLHHNAGFDSLVVKRLQQDGVIPEFSPAEVHCTADMAAYFKLPRALKDIAQFVFKLPDLAKTGRAVRERMKGMPVEKLMDDPIVREYAANDAVLCRRLWMEWSQYWPEAERKVSRISREGGWRGVKIDMAYVDDCVARLHDRMFDAARAIPWDWDPERTPLSRNKMIERARQEVVEERELDEAEVSALEFDPVCSLSECLLPASDEATKTLNALWGLPEGREQRVELYERDERVWARIFMWFPASFAKNDEECAAWEDEYGDRPGFEWIGAVRDWRRFNMILQKFQHLQKFTSPDGRYRVQLKYFGGHTGRWSGGGGYFNVQNLPRGEMFCLKDADKKDVPGTGFDLRRCLLGNFYLTDYNQVEARGLLALVKDERILPKLRAGMSVYQAHAEATTGRTWKDLKKEDFPLYQSKKMEVLLLGFGGGAKKMARAAYLMTKDGPPEGVVRWTEAEAQKIVDDYRAHTRDYICKLWSHLQKLIDKAADSRKELMIIRLPSGRPMYYWNIRRRTVKRIIKTEEGDKLIERSETFSQQAKGDPSSYRKLYGGLLTENVDQGMCRDVLRDGWIALSEAGYDVAFTSHDEYAIDLKPGQTGEAADQLILATGNASWAAFIPLALEGKYSPFYTK